MKWKFRRMVDKFGLWLVSIKPIRWFFDQLVKFGEWASKNPIMRKIWKWYKKSFKPFWVIYGIYWALIDAWHHNFWSMIVNIVCVIIWLILPDNRNRPDNNDDDKPDDPDPSPTGDTVDRWLREQQKVEV